MKMRLTADDEMSGCRTRLSGQDVPDYPEQIVYENYLRNPAVDQGMNRMAYQVVRQAELMGFDTTDPELMGAVFATLFKKIKSAVKKKRAKRKAAAEAGTDTTDSIPTLSVSTKKGVATLGPTGVTWTGTTPAAATAVSTQQTAASTSSVSELMKNPMVIGAAVGIPLLMMMMSKKKGGKK